MITIIDYGIGNLGSIKNALDALEVDAVISDSVRKIEYANALIFPGVGAASEGMKNLMAKGLDKLIVSQIKKGKPLLGICLGMQLLFSSSKEGNTKCLNVIEGKVKKFNIVLKVPQIGWNQLIYQKSNIKDQKLFKDISNGSYFYFVHSYYCQPEETRMEIGTTDYGINFCSAIKYNNIFGVQFHPEKSGKNGLQLLKNFIDIVYANNTGN